MPCKLDDDAVIDCFMSLEPATKLAAKYGVAKNSVYLIRHRKLRTSLTVNLIGPERVRHAYGGRPPMIKPPPDPLVWMKRIGRIYLKPAG